MTAVKFKPVVFLVSGFALSNIAKLDAEVEVTLGLTVNQSVCLGIEYPCGSCDHILFPVGMLLSEICGLVSLGLPLGQEDGSAISIVITQ
jgi:hypothetical protein